MVKRYSVARESAKGRISHGKGLRMRSSGAFALPVDSRMDEPQRTERLLRSPFALHHNVPGDALQSRTGFLFFRVNGLTRFGQAYRLVVLYVNILIGTLGGLTPLSDGPGSASATTQAVSILVLQLGMACYCFCLAPDADKIFSMFSGTQYLVEGLSVACALWVALAAGSVPKDVVTLAFTLAILAVFVPMAQLVEQRLFAPCVGAIRKGGCSLVALAGICCIVCIKLPLLIKKVRVLFGWEDGIADDEVQPDAVKAMGAATEKYGAMVAGHKQTLKRVETKRVDYGGVAAEEHGDEGGGDDDGGD